jgi:hypothetical protein
MVTFIQDQRKRVAADDFFSTNFVIFGQKELKDF